MTPLELIIALLLVIVGVLLFSGLALAVHHYPQLVQPVLVGLTALALMVSIIGVIAGLKP